MPDTERPSLQNLYPTVQAHAGMDARSPTKFTIPIFSLSLLLFLPLYSIAALVSLYTYSKGFTITALAINSIGFYGASMVAGLLSIALLGYARTLITRNCRHPLWVEGMYAVVVVPAVYLLVSNFGVWFKGATTVQMLEIEAGIILGLVLATAIFARWQTR